MTETTPAKGPLDGIRILDFTALLQGPLATQILADLGADVVKLEKPGGEWMRHWGICMTRTHGETDAYLAFNRNKRSVEVDMKSDEDRALVMDLVKKADVVVENFRPGVMDRIGFGYDALRALNPRLIYAASSGYGQTGPYVARPGQDFLVQALTGSMWMHGRRDDPPMITGIAVADQFTGVHLVVAILAALVHRERTGEGQRVDVDLMSCMMAAQQQELTVHWNSGHPMTRAAENVGCPGVTGPCGVYETADGYMMLAMFPCPTLGEILGVDWLDAYDTNDKMMAFRDDIYLKLARHFKSDTTANWVTLLSAGDVWCAPVRHHSDLKDDPQVQHRQLIWDVPYGDGAQSYKTVGSPFGFSQTPTSVRQSAPSLGQHTDDFRAGRIW